MLILVFSMAPVGSPEVLFKAYLSTDSVNPGDDFFIEGIAYGQENVNILIVSPSGPYGDRIDGSGTGIYHRIASVSDIDNTFSLKISVGLEVKTGSYSVLVLNPGRDCVYNGFTGDVGVSNFVEELEDQYGPLGFTQDQFLAIIEDATINALGTDDLMWTDYIDVGRGGKRPYGACAHSEEGVMSIDIREFVCDCTFHWAGGAAASLSDYIDKNYYSIEVASGRPDGHCSEGELDDYIRHELNRQQKDEMVNNMLIDGTRGEIIGSDCKYRYPGYGAIKEDLKIKCTYWIKFRDLERSNEHVYSRVGLNDGDFVSFTVPTGWIISSTEDLKGSSISSNNRTVIGVATDKAYVIKFSKAGIPSPSVTSTPVPSPTPTASTVPAFTPTPKMTPSPSPKETPTTIPAAEAPEEPGFEAVFAIAGPLAVAYLLRRKG